MTRAANTILKLSVSAVLVIGAIVLFLRFAVPDAQTFAAAYQTAAAKVVPVTNVQQGQDTNPCGAMTGGSDLKNLASCGSWIFANYDFGDIWNTWFNQGIRICITGPGAPKPGKPQEPPSNPTPPPCPLCQNGQPGGDAP